MLKVYTRNARGIRGHVEAYVAAFDKHWNLALEDCFETWSRKVKRKAPALGMFIQLILVFCYLEYHGINSMLFQKTEVHIY